MICAAADDPFADFKPLPWLGHPHVQTLLGHLLQGPTVTLTTRRHTLRLPDGDHLLVYDNVPPGWKPGDPVAVLVHGLTGSHASGGMQRPAVMLLQRNIRVVRFDRAAPGMAWLWRAALTTPAVRRTFVPSSKKPAGGARRRRCCSSAFHSAVTSY